jgi:hypothetical protein
MVPYVQSVASQQAPPPYFFPGVTVNAFVWEAPLGPIQRLCDTYYNLGDPRERGFVYKPLAAWPYATLLLIEYPVMMCADPRQLGLGGMSYADRGYMSQHEVFVAIPLLRYGATAATLLSSAAIEWALPFIVVENPTSAVCGREMLGLEKLQGDIELGEGAFRGSFRGKVVLPGWPSLDPDVMQQAMTFLTVETGPPTPTFRGSPEVDSLWTLLQSRAASRAIDALSSVADMIDQVSDRIIPTAMQVITLKQFRDAGFPERAVFQSLVTCRAKYSNITDFHFYKEDDVAITFHAEGSFKEIVQVFLDTDKTTTFRPIAGYRFGADIDFDDMRTIYNFPIDGAPGLPPSPASGDMLAPWLRPLRGFLAPRPSSQAPTGSRAS